MKDEQERTDSDSDHIKDSRKAARPALTERERQMKWPVDCEDDDDDVDPTTGRHPSRR